MSFTLSREIQSNVIGQNFALRLEAQSSGTNQVAPVELHDWIHTSNLTHPDAALPAFPTLFRLSIHMNKEGEDPTTIQTMLATNRDTVSATAASVSPVLASSPAFWTRYRTARHTIYHIVTPLVQVPAKP
jgi:hypothetical protein